ncbi:hypothetical protein B0J15DRAFT_46966 [Fusarium solani]|uniref:Uncharacterized protein n=1 Tax=Fusarium solani TaxID=169388 RepID=A0A9P9H5E9_FUSSL|nr:uncharacterized protein B0J15DRAFT_46966 [Fusarium solani]KAH7250643.1 hypothetical protein B0J15DRAFT_46966 [Fusarium solani]
MSPTSVDTVRYGVLAHFSYQLSVQAPLGQFTRQRLARLFSGRLGTCSADNRIALNTKNSSKLHQVFPITIDPISKPTFQQTTTARDWFSGKILRCHSCNVGEPWVRFPDHALLSQQSISSVIGLVVKFSVAIRAASGSPGFDSQITH